MSRIGLALQNFVVDYYGVYGIQELDDILIDFTEGFTEVFAKLEELYNDDDVVYSITPKGERWLKYLELKKEFEN